MKEKNLPEDKSSLSLEDLTKEATKIIEKLENEKDLENSINTYQELIKLNNFIEKKFYSKSKKINEKVKQKIKDISKKKDAK
tara:strand:+ start:393 stop:638 length:246 start_codon:yes stop_codon:yes gene_type:complete